MTGKLFKALMVLGLLCSGTMADLSTFEHALGSSRNYDLNDSRDGRADGSTGYRGPSHMIISADNHTYQFFPNNDMYDPSDPRWSDGAGDGNRWVISWISRERLQPLTVDEVGATMTINVSAFDLDDRYSLTAYINTYHPFSFITQVEDSVEINGAGSTTLSIDSLSSGEVIQFGFRMEGINANPATDWGSATVTVESVNVVPEPSTIGLLGLSGGVLVLFRRRLRREKNDPTLPRLKHHHSIEIEPGF